MQRLVCLIGYVCLVLAASAAAAQTRIHYVLPGAGGSGVSWSDASGNLRVILAAARPGDEVWVGGGTYAPTSCVSCERADQLVSFVLPKGVKLRGGFTGAESTPAERRSDAVATVLSGRIGPDTSRAKESLTIMVSDSPTRGTLIERITFAYGNANEAQHGYTDPIVSGAQLDVFFREARDANRLEVVDCAFLHARSVGYGGAVLVDGKDRGRSEVWFRGCRFEDNASTLGGGAVYITGKRGGLDESRFTDCGFRQNAAGTEGGGAIHWTGADTGRVAGQIADCVFRDNSSLGGGGAIRLNGIMGDVSLAVDRTLFEGNEAQFGGACEVDVHFDGRAGLTFRDSRFFGNATTGGGGGAVYSNANDGGDADPVFERCVLRGNRSAESGGALFFSALRGRSHPRVIDCRLEENTAHYYGGAIYNFGRGGVIVPTLINTIIARNTASSAGGIYALGSDGGVASARILNCAFVNNRATIGGALYSNANDELGTAAPFVQNTIFQGNQAETGHTLRNVYGRPTLAYCSFDRPDCESLRSGFGQQQTCVEGNLFGVPDVFVDTAAGDYRLRDGAIVVDAGFRDTLLAREVFYDLDSNARYRGASIDIGPIELASDPLPWSVLASSRDSKVCAGALIHLVGSVDAAFPSEASWSFGESLLSTELSPEVNASSVGGRQTYVFTTTAYGESLRDSVTVDVEPRTTTRFAVEVALPKDTLVVGQQYALSAKVEPREALTAIAWRNTAGELLSSETSWTFSPESVGPGSISVEASFEGTCLDAAARDSTLPFIA